MFFDSLFLLSNDIYLAENEKRIKEYKKKYEKIVKEQVVDEETKIQKFIKEYMNFDDEE